MFRLFVKRFASASPLVAVVLCLSVASSSGCASAPFYRMTNKASQSLPLSREGIAAYERGNYAVAEEKLAQAVQLNDSDVETCRYYGETLWRRGKRTEAINALTQAAEKNGPIDSQASLRRSLGEKALACDRPELALEWASRAVDLSPKRAESWELRGKVYRRLGDLKSALDDFQRATQYAQDERELLREIASIQFELGDFDSSLASWQYLERLYPTNREPAEVFAGKGGAYWALGLVVDAQESYETATALAPQNAEYRVALAQVALERGNVELATSALNEAMRLDPENQKGLAFASVLRRRLEQTAATSEGALR